MSEKSKPAKGFYGWESSEEEYLKIKVDENGVLLTN